MGTTEPTILLPPWAGTGRPPVRIGYPYPVDPMTIELDTAVAERLADNNLRYTDGRRRVIRAIATGEGPMSADDIHRKLRRRMSLASLYRSLSQMQDVGVLTAHYSQGRTARFELADWLAGHHHHLICGRCERIIELALTDEEESAIDDILASVAERYGFLPTDHALDVDGVCSNCLDPSGPDRTARMA